MADDDQEQDSHPRRENERTRREKDEEMVRRDAQLERALEDSFPASDPVSPAQPTSREPPNRG
jgi:hypothetical protein